MNWRLMLTLIASADPLAREMTWVDVPGEMLLEPRVTMNDFLKSVKNRFLSPALFLCRTPDSLLTLVAFAANRR
jgi:hypothetical protein